MNGLLIAGVAAVWTLICVFFGYTIAVVSIDRAPEITDTDTDTDT